MTYFCIKCGKYHADKYYAHLRYRGNQPKRQETEIPISNNHIVRIGKLERRVKKLEKKVRILLRSKK